MPEAPLQPESPLQRQIVAFALQLAAKLEARAAQARPGQILAECEALLLDDGRQFLRDSLATTLQHHAHEGEKKGAPTEPVLVDTPAGTRAPESGKS